MKYKDPTTGEFKEIKIRATDELPVGSEIDVDDNTTIPAGWEQTTDPNTYSTEEQRIGTWMGKPLYRKAKIITSKSSSDLYTEALVNVDEITNMYGMAYFGSRGQPIPRVLTDGNANYALGLGDIDISSNGIAFRFQIGSSYSNFTKATIVIEYTKTTD